MEKLKFGIIGCGIIAPFHAEAISLCEDAELYAVCDILSDRAAEFARKHGAEKVYTDYREMLRDSSVQAVCICTPSGLHGQMAVDAARAGRHVFCEKPIEITREKLNYQINEVEKTGVRMGCVFQRRTYPESIAVKQALDAGKFGKLLVADAYLKYYRSPEYYKSADWRATWELDGGGALMNQGVHGVDMILWLAGEVESVYARTAAQMHRIDVEDTAIAVLKYKSGAMGVIEGATCVQPAQATRFELHGERGSVIFGDDGILQWHMTEHPEDRPPELAKLTVSAKEDPKNIAASSHYVLVRDFIDAVREQRDPLVTPRSARRAVDLILAIYESSRTGREVFL